MKKHQEQYPGEINDLRHQLNKRNAQVTDLESKLTAAAVKLVDGQKWEKRFDSLLAVLEKLAEAASKGRLPAVILMLIPYLLIAGAAALALGMKGVA